MLDEFSAPNPDITNKEKNVVASDPSKTADDGRGASQAASELTADEFAKELEAGMANLLSELESSVRSGPIPPVKRRGRGTTTNEWTSQRGSENWRI